MPTELDWARLAAYIDGEGTIWISTYRWYVAKNKAKPYQGWRMELCVANTDPRLVIWLKTTFGGWVTIEQHKGRRRRVMFKWRIAATKASDILQHCLPYFIIKTAEASIAIAFQSTMSHRHARGVSSELATQRNAFKLELSRLKHRVHEVPSSIASKRIN